MGQALQERALKVIPAGMWGHQRVAAMPSGYPQFFTGGKGARVTDVDGHEYIDFMCSWGPIILGHQHPEVEEAVAARWNRGDCLNGPTDQVVELAELLVNTIPMADWAMFQKNGCDATTACVTIARAATGKRKLLLARGAYHGAVPWCSPSLVGVTAEDRAHILSFDYNNTESLAHAVAQAGDDLAAILVAPFRHDLGIRQEEPTSEFVTAIRGHCDSTGAALVLDDVRAGFRLDLGGSWEPFGVRPDLAAYSKAIANGHPLAAVVGNDRFREAAGQIFITGSFWYTGAPMAAAIATIRELQKSGGPELIQASGQRLRDGLQEQSLRHGFELTQSGPPAMPLLQFSRDHDARLGAAFCQEALSRGVYMHHRHNMFLSTAHTFEEIDKALEATDSAFSALAKKRKAYE